MDNYTTFGEYLEQLQVYASNNPESLKMPIVHTAYRIGATKVYSNVPEMAKYIGNGLYGGVVEYDDPIETKENYKPNCVVIAR